LLGAVNPAYIRLLFVDPMGKIMLMVGGTMQLIGSFFLWKIVHIDV
jgi:Flp pilus assembly protein TadB